MVRGEAAAVPSSTKKCIDSDRPHERGSKQRLPPGKI